MNRSSRIGCCTEIVVIRSFIAINHYHHFKISHSNNTKKSIKASLSFQDKWISHLTRLQTVTVKVVTSWRQMLEQTMKTHAVETLVRLKFTTFSFLSRYFLKSWTYLFFYFPQINSCLNRRSTRYWRWGWGPHCGRNIEWRGYRLRQVWKYELSANQQRYLDEDVQLYSLGWGYYWKGASSR